MKTVFPIILTPADVGYVVTIPDLNINTEGSSVADAIEMARDAIGLWGICEEDAGREIPKASTDTPPHKSDEIVTLVDIDFSAYCSILEINISNNSSQFFGNPNNRIRKSGCNIFSEIF